MLDWPYCRINIPCAELCISDFMVVRVAVLNGRKC